MMHVDRYASLEVNGYRVRDFGRRIMKGTVDWFRSLPMLPKTVARTLRIVVNSENSRVRYVYVPAICCFCSSSLLSHLSLYHLHISSRSNRGICVTFLARGIVGRPTTAELQHNPAPMRTECHRPPLSLHDLPRPPNSVGRQRLRGLHLNVLCQVERPFVVETRATATAPHLTSTSHPR